LAWHAAIISFPATAAPAAFFGVLALPEQKDRHVDVVVTMGVTAGLLNSPLR